MSAVSKNVTPASRAASTTARVPFRSTRRPKLLQPRPTTDVRIPDFPSSREGRSAMNGSLVRRGGRSVDVMIVSPQGVGEALGHRRALALLPQRHDDQLVALGPADEDQVTAVDVADQDRASLAGLDPAGGVGARD